MAPFAVPIASGKEQDWRAFMQELTGARITELRDFNSRHGLTTHRAWLEAAPDGSYLALVELEGPGAEGFLDRLATSEHPFDRWFRETVSAIHGIDFARVKMQPPELLMDSVAP